MLGYILSFVGGLAIGAIFVLYLISETQDQRSEMDDL